MLAAGSPEFELALVLADAFPPPTAPEAPFAPNVLLTKMGVSYLTSENPLLYIFGFIIDLNWFTNFYGS